MCRLASHGKGGLAPQPYGAFVLGMQSKQESLLGKGVPKCCKQQKRRRWRLPGPGLWFSVREEGRVVWAVSAVATVGFTKEQGGGVCCGEPTH